MNLLASTVLILCIMAHTILSVDYGGDVTTLTPLGQQLVFSGATIPLQNLTFLDPRGITTTLNNDIIITDESYIVRVSSNLSIASLFAGRPTLFGYLDGPATTAQLNLPMGVAAIGNTVYFADSQNHAVRRVVSGTVTTLAGRPPPTPQSGNTDGTGSSASFDTPGCLTVDPRNSILYVCDLGNAQIRRVTTAGVVTTLASTSPAGINSHVGIWIRASTLYISQQVPLTATSTIITVQLGAVTITTNNLGNVSQFPITGAVSPDNSTFFITQDNRIGTLSDAGIEGQLTGQPAPAAVLADGRFPQITPVFTRLAGIARAGDSLTYYTIESGASPRLRSVVVFDITEQSIPFTVNSVPPITNSTLQDILFATVSNELEIFLAGFGQVGRVVQGPVIATGNTFTAMVPTFILDESTVFLGTLNNQENAVQQTLATFRAPTPINITVPSTNPPRSLMLANAESILATAYTNDLNRLTASHETTNATVRIMNDNLLFSAFLPGTFVNSTTQSLFNVTALGNVTALLNDDEVLFTPSLRIFEGLNTSQLQTVNDLFTEDLAMFADSSNVASGPVRIREGVVDGVNVISAITLNARSVGYIAQALQMMVDTTPLASFTSLVTFLNNFDASQVVTFNNFPNNAARRAQSLENITRIAREFATVNLTTRAINVSMIAVTLASVSSRVATVNYTYPLTFNGIDFNDANYTGAVVTDPSPACGAACIALAASIPGAFVIIVLLLLIAFLIYYFLKKNKEKKAQEKVAAPQFQPVFRGDHADSPQKPGSALATLSPSNNPLYHQDGHMSERRRNDELFDQQSQDALDVRLQYHALRDAAHAPPQQHRSSLPSSLARRGSPSEMQEDVIRVLHVSPRREGSRSSRPNPLVYDSAMRKLDNPNAAAGEDSLIRVVKVIPRDSPSRSSRSSSRSKRQLRVEASPERANADAAVPQTVTAVESALRQL